MSVSKFSHEGYFDPTVHDALRNIEIEERASRREILQKQIPNYRPLVYICSPYADDIPNNERRARQFCEYAVQQRCIPIAPHLLFPQFLDERNPTDRELGLFMGLVLLTKCVEMWVLGAYISTGMQREIDKAEERGLPIRFFSEDFEEVIP